MTVTTLSRFESADLRIEALRFANMTSGTSEEIVARAQAYYAFLSPAS